MSEPRVSLSSRRSQDSRRSGPVSHGRGGTGNIAMDETEYVDAGLYVEETPGSDGKGYSGGRGGAGNIKGPVKNGREHISDRRDCISEVSAIPAPAEGEGYSTGRGGAANVHAKRAPVAEEKRASTNDATGSNHVANMGLADKLKYKLFRRKPLV